MRAVIIGGGVGGCAMAAALRGSVMERDAVIVERRALGSPAGMGFILMPNGLAALKQLIPEVQWRGAGRSIDRVMLWTAEGTLLSDCAIDAAVCVGREKFLGLLRAATGRTQFREGAQVNALVRDALGATQAIELADHSTIEGDAFFGCDGATSRVRGIVFPEAQLAEVVVKEIVSVAHAPALAQQLGNTFHKFHDEEGGLAVGMLAQSDERVVWFIQFDARRWELHDPSADTLARFAKERIHGWNAQLQQAWQSTDFTRSHLWPTRDLPPMPAIACENLALLGDAAHACLPFTSQGANGALVDAAILQVLLARVTDHAGICRAFAKYSAVRRLHHRRMFLEGRRLRDAFLAPLRGGSIALPLID